MKIDKDIAEQIVREEAAQIFANKCIAMGVREAAVVMVSEHQEALKVESLSAWASERGMSLTLFHGWDGFIEQALFWAGVPKLGGARQAVAFIRERLQGVEASAAGVALWDELSGQ